MDDRRHLDRDCVQKLLTGYLSPVIVSDVSTELTPTTEQTP